MLTLVHFTISRVVMCSRRIYDNIKQKHLPLVRNQISVEKTKCFYYFRGSSRSYFLRQTVSTVYIFKIYFFFETKKS